MAKKHEIEKFIEKIFNEMNPELTKFIYRYSYDKEYVEDILQETYLAAYRHADELIGNEKYKSWMYATAANKAKKMNKMNQKHGECVSLESQVDLCVDIHNDEMFDYDIRKILSDEEYKLLIMHYDEGYSYKEIGDKYGKESSCIKMRVFRIIKKISDTMKL